MLLSVDDSGDVTLRKIVTFVLGPKSKVGQFIRDELELDDKLYLQFMSTYCLQAAYRLSCAQLFDNSSALKKELVISEAEYHEIWRRMAEKKKDVDSPDDPDYKKGTNFMGDA